MKVGLYLLGIFFAIALLILFPACGRSRPLSIAKEDRVATEYQPLPSPTPSPPRPTPMGCTGSGCGAIETDPPPFSTSLTATPAVVPHGGSATLHFSAVGAAYCSLTENGTPLPPPTQPTGQAVVGPLANPGPSVRANTYSFRCSSASGQQSVKTAVINILSAPPPPPPPPPAPVCTGITVTPEIALPGERRVLFYQASGVIGRRVISSGDPARPVAADGSFSPTQAGTAQVTLEGPGGVAVCRANYRVYSTVGFNTPVLHRDGKVYLIEDCGKETADFYCHGMGFLGSAGFTRVEGPPHEGSLACDASIRPGPYWFYNGCDGISSLECTRITCFR